MENVEIREELNMYKSLDYESWQSLKANVIYDICHSNSFPHNRFIFRGHSDESWTLTATFDRMYGDLSFDKKKEIENYLIEQFRMLCVDWDSREKFNEYDKNQLLSIGQHYGLPTRLLDWSYSIYIAAFFAFCAANKTTESSVIWVIDKENEIWKGDYGVTILTNHMTENERQKFQYGLFTLNTSTEVTLEDYVMACSKRTNVENALFKILIPASERKSVLNDLDMMGINYFNLYRGIEGCAKSAIIKEILR